MKKLLCGAIITLLVCLTGCGGKTDAGSASGQLRQVSREKTLIFENIEGRIPMPNNQNPYVNGQYLDWGLWQANQESLFYYNYETAEIMPWIASGYQFNSGYTAVKITLREGVFWSDGVPFTPGDIVFTIDMLKKNTDLRFSGEMNELVKEVKINNEHEVEFILSKPNPTFIMDFFAVKVWQTLLIAPKHIWENVDPNTFTNFDPEKGYPVGTGPYSLVRSTETEQVYDRNEKWWGSESGFDNMPEPERVIWIVVGSEEIRAAMLVNNELDVAWTLGKRNFEIAKSKNPNIISWSSQPPLGWLDPVPLSLGFNNDAFPFNDPELKWAINSAINRDEIVNIVYEGLSEPAATMYPAYKPLKEFLDRNAGLFTTYPVLTTDLNRTASIMQGKGYTKDKEGLWTNAGGGHITFTIIARSGESYHLKAGPVLAQQLTKAGFDVDFQPYESSVFYNEVYTGKALCYIGGVLASVDNPYSTFNYFHGKWYKPSGEMTDAHSYRWRNSEFDRLVDIMVSLPPEDKKFRDAADRALEIWLEELPALGLAQVYLITPFNATYWTNWPSADNNYIQPTHWWVTGNQLIHNIRAAN
jgi:peptide/nickel transport system substrate-binding protein